MAQQSSEQCNQKRGTQKTHTTSVSVLPILCLWLCYTLLSYAVPTSTTMHFISPNWPVPRCQLLVTSGTTECQARSTIGATPLDIKHQVNAHRANMHPHSLGINATALKFHFSDARPDCALLVHKTDSLITKFTVFRWQEARTTHCWRCRRGSSSASSCACS